MADQAYEPRLKTEYRQRIRAAMKDAAAQMAAGAAAPAAKS